MRVVYMGTPDFAVPCLKALIASEKYEVVGVFTQPDRYRGKKEQVSFSPVKTAAVEAGIPVFQPEKYRDPGNFEILQELAPELIVVAAYGQILPLATLELPKYGCINVHASLLPKYRGAAPIQRVILEGESKTGITIMQMAEGIDTGDMLARVEVDIAADDTGDSLHDKLAACAPQLLLDTLDLLVAGRILPEKQDDSKSSYAKMLKKTLGQIDFTMPALVIERYVRGLNSWPSAYTFLDGLQLKIWKASVDPVNSELEPGQICEVTNSYFAVQTGEGVLRLEEIQLQGKKRMETAAFLRGYSLAVGKKLN